MKINSRRVFRVLAWIIGVFLVLWLLIWTFVIFNKKRIIAEVNTQLNSKIKGEIKIGDLEPSLISTFPHVSLRLSNVLVRDTMWKVHHHDMLKADNVFIRLGLWSLFTGSPEISKVIVQNASVYIFSDTTGFSNEYMFKPQKSSTEGATPASRMSPPDVELRNVRLVLDFKDRNKLYDFEVRSLDCNIKTRETTLQLDVKTNMTVHSLAFNLDNGSFIKDKPVRGKFRVNFDTLKKKLEFNNIVLNIDEHPFTVSGMFDLSSVPPLYFLSIKTENLKYKDASSLVSANIRKKLDIYRIEKPVSISGTLDGSTMPNKTPLVNLKVVMKDNTVTTPFGMFTEVSVTGFFNNQLIAQETRSDQNSGFRFTSFSGKWENILLRSDTVKVTNLDHPVLDCDLHSSFGLRALNDVVGSSTIEFTRGSCQADVRYKGLVVPGDTAAASVFGNIKLEDAAIKYIPRNLQLSDCSGKVEFDDKDVYVRQLKGHVGSSQFVMNGGVKNLMNLIDNSPEKLVLNWNIASSRLNLGDFLSYLGKASTSSSKKTSKSKVLKLAGKIDRMLEDCSVGLQLNADRLTYKKFDATNVAANLQLTNNMVSLNNVLIHHAGGMLSLNGLLREDPVNNFISLTSDMSNVDITKVFAAFNNFGQDGITDRNLRGRLTARINVTGEISDKAVVVENSLKGVVDFSLKDGELIDFEPVKNIANTAFKNKDLSNIRFAELKEKLEVNGSQIKVNRMEIHSSVLTMFVEGIYDVKKGTDLSIQIPLNNLTKSKDEFNLKNKGVNSKTGVSLRLRARTGENGKAKISWDPFNRALKNQDKSTSDTTTVATPDSTGRRRKKH